MTRALTLCVACLVVLVAAAPASASSFAVGSPEFGDAVQIGQQHWGGMPCGGQVRFGWTDEDPAVNATSYWSPGFTNCEIVFNRSAGMSYAKFCTVMAHELGHLHGRAHVDDPGDLMSAIYSGALPACAGGHAEPAEGFEEEAPTDPEALVGIRMTKAQVRAARAARACERRRTRRAVRRCKRTLARRAARRKRNLRRSANAISATVLLTVPALAGEHGHE